MPSFASGVAAQANLSNSISNRRQVQLQAERDRVELTGKRAVQTQQQETIAAIQADTDARIGELRDKATIGELDMAFEGVANRNFDALNDFMADPDNLEMLQGMPALTDAFGDSPRAFRQFNPNSESDVAARNKYAQEFTGGKSNYDDSFDGLKKFIDDNTIAVDLAGGGTELVRADEFLELLGTTERRSAARRIFNTKNDEIARIMRESEEAKLSVLDPSYKGSGSSAIEVAKLEGQRLSNAKLRRDLMGGQAPKDKLKFRKDTLTLLSESAERGFTYKSLLNENKEYGSPFSDEEVQQIFDYAGDEAQRKERQLVVSERGLELSERREHRLATQEPAPTVYEVKKGDMINAETELSTLMGERSSFSELNEEEREKFRALYADYRLASGEGPLNDSSKDNIAFGYRFLDSIDRFSEAGYNESVRGVYDDTRNFVLEYVETDSPERRRAISLNLAALLGSVRLDKDRTPKYIFDEMKKQFGSEFGKSFVTAVEGSISAVRDLQSEFKARSGAAASNNFESVVFQDVLSKSEPTLKRLQQFISGETTSATKESGVSKVKKFLGLN